MAQQVFPQWSPVVKAHNEDQQEVYIPAAIIHAQTRDGKDELIVGAANMQKDDVTGLYLPTDKDFPLEARVRHLEELIGKLDASKETDPDAASATLLALLRGLLATIAAIKDNDGIKKIADAVTVNGLNALATESTLGEVKLALAALGATSDAAETDPAETASQIALLKGLLTRLNTVAGTVVNGAAKVTLTGQNVEILAEYQGYTGHNAQAPSARYFGATVGTLMSARPLDVRRFGGLVLKLTNGYNVAVTHRVVAFKSGEPGSPIWVDVTEDADLPAGAEFIYEIPNRYPYIALRVYAPARDQTGETGLDVDIVGSVFYA